MSTLYKTIMSLCEYRGIKGGKMCADIGISKSMLSDLKMGRKKTLSAETLAKIANYFSVSVDSILQAGNFVDEWEIDCWEDWDNAKTEDDQRKILKMHGVPKELVSEYWNMVIKKETPAESGERTLAFDDFTYAMHEASKNLSERDKQILLGMAEQLKKAKDKE